MYPDVEERLHRTWVQLLVELGHRELAAAALDGSLSLIQTYHGKDYGLFINISPSAYGLLGNDQASMRTLENSLKLVAKGYLTDQNGNELEDEEPSITFRIKLLDIEEDWKSVVRNLIVNHKDSNQGIVSELLASRRGQSVLKYNEMNFASQSEIRIAQEFETRKLLFFPLPLAVRADSGIRYKDHREADFLVCDDGVWGILEVSYHPDRFEKDAEKDAWFKKSGILCVQHYSAERCYNQPGEVVDEFMMILAKHKR